MSYKYLVKQIKNYQEPLADRGGGRVLGMRASLGVQILSFSCSFRQKKLQNNRLTYPLWELAPQENP